MRYVIIRDDDTNALTPVECLERLYRPFLDRGLPVNLAAIPDVRTNARMADGQPEGFLFPHRRNGSSAGFQSAVSPIPNRQTVPASPSVPEAGRLADCNSAIPQMENLPYCQADATLPIGTNAKLVRYLQENAGYHIVQHGCHHDYLEFDRRRRAEIAGLLERGTEALAEAGFPRSQTFVAPYDKLSSAALREVAGRFRVLSTGWYELRRLPCSWWPRYVVKRLRHTPHWSVGQTLLLSHPGCLLSCHHTYSTMLGALVHYLGTQQLTVLVTHWWEYFPETGPDEDFIDLLHETAGFLASHPQLQVISFDDLANGKVRVN